MRYIKHSKVFGVFSKIKDATIWKEVKIFKNELNMYLKPYLFSLWYLICLNLKQFNIKKRIGSELMWRFSCISSLTARISVMLPLEIYFCIRLRNWYFFTWHFEAVPFICRQLSKGQKARSSVRGNMPNDVTSRNCYFSHGILKLFHLFTDRLVKGKNQDLLLQVTCPVMGMVFMLNHVQSVHSCV